MRLMRVGPLNMLLAHHRSPLEDRGLLFPVTLYLAAVSRIRICHAAQYRALLHTPRNVTHARFTGPRLRLHRHRSRPARGNLSADPVPVRHPQGSSHGFLALRTLDGKSIAIGDATQIVQGDRVTSRVIFRFRDGSIDDDITVFSQRASSV